MPEHKHRDRAHVEWLIKQREKQKADAPQATADYYAAQQRLRDRTQELRRLRLAHEARTKVQSG